MKPFNVCFRLPLGLLGGTMHRISCKLPRFTHRRKSLHRKCSKPALSAWSMSRTSSGDDDN